MSRKEKFDEFYEKPSKHRRWNEGSLAPVLTRSMRPEDIGKFREVLAKSYNVETEEIRFVFERITDENDEDRTDSIWIRFYLKCIVAGNVEDRNVYSTKIIMPEEYKESASQSSRAGKRAPARARALPSTSEPATAVAMMRHPRAGMPPTGRPVAPVYTVEEPTIPRSRQTRRN